MNKERLAGCQYELYFFALFILILASSTGVFFVYVYV
jgi:hypothetical protein